MKYKSKYFSSAFRLASGNGFAKYTLSLISGVLMGLTVAPISAWFLAWVALAPLWVLTAKDAKGAKREEGRGRGKAGTEGRGVSVVWLAVFWGIGYHGVALSWIIGLHPLTWLGVPWLASVAVVSFCWAFITLWGAALVAVWALVMRFLSLKYGWARVLIGTALWCALEAIWSAGPLWWTSLSYTQSPYNLPVLHLGQLSGTSTVTAAIVAVNGLIAEGFINRRCTQIHADRLNFSALRLVGSRYVMSAIAFLVTLHLIGFGLSQQPLHEASAAALKVGIIQGNVPNRIKFRYDGLQRAATNYTNGYLALVEQGVDAVLTPEGAFPFGIQDIVDTPLVAEVREKGVTAWVGGFNEQYTNTIFTFTGNGDTFSHYTKVKLVPLGEYIPFADTLGKFVKRLSPVSASQVPGKANQVFDTPFGRAIVGICYESAFPYHFRNQAAAGGQFILTASNNDPYNAAMQFQHHAQDTMRAIETDRWAVRATNTGLSAFVNPHGKTVWMSGHKSYEVRAETIYRRQTQTLYVLWGDWLMPTLLGVGVVVWLIDMRAGVD